MALPNILRRLFKGGGYGPELNDGVVSKTISNQGWSNSYDYPVGVVVRGSDGALYYSVEQSGPGTSAGAKDPAQGGNPDFWKKFGSGDSIPTGTVLWLSTPTVPIGFLLCNGSAVGRETYPDLFAAIGTTYGVGDGSTTFNLPNLIDKFAQGGAVAGVAKDAGLPNITGDFTPYSENAGYQHNDPVGAFYVVNNTQKGFGNDLVDNDNERIGFDASRSNSIYGASDTVQPPALTLLPCIKAYSSVENIGSLDAAQLESELQNFAGNVTPIGTILWLSTPSVPAGYLLCNGAAVSRTAYPELFTAIGTTYGAGDGSTTFNLPNLIDKFAQGSAVAGTVKNAGLPNIYGYIGDNVSGSKEASGCFLTKNQNLVRSLVGNGNSVGYSNGIFDASLYNPIYGNSDTVQPPALTLLPCIKAFSSVVGDATVVAGQLVNDIQSKVALDGSNLSGATVKAVVETWHSGTEWYRVWSDGWIEQGGYLALSSNLTAPRIATLSKPFSNTNYVLSFCSLNDDDMTYNARYLGACQKTTTSFTTYVPTSNYRSYGANWFACGF